MPGLSHTPFVKQHIVMIITQNWYDTPNPPVQARNLYSVSVCMYDAWAAYDPLAVGFIYHGKSTAVDVAAARAQAISYAAYRMLRERYVYSKSAATTLAALDAQMVALGYDTNNF